MRPDPVERTVELTHSECELLWAMLIEARSENERWKATKPINTDAANRSIERCNILIKKLGRA